MKSSLVYVIIIQDLGGSSSFDHIKDIPVSRAMVSARLQDLLPVPVEFLPCVQGRVNDVHISISIEH